MSTDETDIPTFGLSLFSDLDRVAKGLCGHVIDGRFRLEECIGEGGFGWVYRARQVSPGRFVAVKVSKRPAEASARMGREADYQGSLDHPSIVNIIEAGTFETGKGLRRYVAMELVRDGRRIDHYCRDLKLHDRPRINLFLSVCDAVAFAHRKNIIHRDLKPANILVRDDGVPKVIDFGIAKALGAVDESHPCETSRADGKVLGHTETAGGMGTNGYMSPEQSARGSSIDARTDVFALGRVLEDIFRVDDKSQAGSRLPAWLVPVRDRCSRTDPADRYADAADLAKAIRSRLPLARFHSLGRWPVGLAVAAGVALIVLVTRSDPSANEPPPPPWPETQGIELSNVKMLSIDQAGKWSARGDDQGVPTVARVGEPLTVCQRLPGLSTPLAAVAIDPGGTWVAAASVGGPIGIWNLPTVRHHANPRLLKLPEAGGKDWQLKFSNGSRRLFGVDQERRVGAWDLESGSLAGVASLAATETAGVRITSLCSGAGDEQVVVGCSDGTVRSWNVGAPGFSQLPDPHSDGPVFLAGHVRRGLIASVGQDRLVCFRRIRDGRVIAESMRLPGLPRAVTFDGSGENLLLAIRPDEKSTDSLVAINTRAPTAVLVGKSGDPADRLSTIQRLIAAEGGVLAAIGLDAAGEPKAWIWSSNQPRLASAAGLMTEADPAPEL